MIPRRFKRWLPFLLVGILLGAGGGLLIGWFLWPLEYVDAELVMLAPEEQMAYLDLVGLNYGLTGNLPQAQARLYNLQWPDAQASVVARALEHIEQRPDSAMAQGMALLAQDLGANEAEINQYLVNLSDAE